MNVQLKRVRSVAWANETTLDLDFQEGSIIRYPKVGETLTFRFNRLGKGEWYTTPIKAIKKRPGVTVLITENSEYHVKKGWAE